MSGDSLPNGLVCACDEASANEHNVTRSNAHGVFFMAVPLEGVALHDLTCSKGKFWRTRSAVPRTAVAIGRNSTLLIGANLGEFQ